MLVVLFILIVVLIVFMSVTSVLICRMILRQPRFCSVEFFTFCYEY